MATTNALLSGRTILIVDDSLEISALLRDFFLARGAHPILTHNASQAFGLLQQSTFDLVVLDLAMSFVDCTSILQFLGGRKRRGLSRQTIVLNDNCADNELIRKVHSMGMPLLIKPFDLQELLDICVRLLSVTDVRTLLTT